MAHDPERGTSLAELLVGLLIGLVVGLIVLNMLMTAEGVKRSTLGIADAQQTGALATFTLAATSPTRVMPSLVRLRLQPSVTEQLGV